MNVKYYLKKVDGLITPNRANETDAGYDVIATSEPKIVGNLLSQQNPTMAAAYFSIDYIEFETNLYFVPVSPTIDGVGPFKVGVETFNYHTDMRPRSSISKYNLVLANSIGLIDRGYHNQVLARFKYIWQPTDFRVHIGESAVPDMSKVYKKGDKICQVLPMVTHNIEFVMVDELPGSNRGGGFGSTGK